jgi:hypothetical protein
MTNPITNAVQRRLFLRQSAYGLGTMALSQLLAGDQQLATASDRTDPLRPKLPHYTPKAKNVIFLNMAGGPSQFDLFTPKPQLQRLHGQPVPESFLSGLLDPVLKGSATAMATPRSFARYGQSGLEFSELLPHLSQCADDLCMMRAVHSDTANHHPAQLLLNCGTQMFDHPSMGSWVTYGLGSESHDLPGFVVLTSFSKPATIVNPTLWTNGFLPSTFRGTAFRNQGDPILDLANPAGVSNTFQRARLDTINQLNQQRLGQTHDSEIASRIASYELAYRMQMAAPELVDFSDESPATLAMYGLDDEKTRSYGTNCLLARRMVERGVRFVQLYHADWDHHADLNKLLTDECRITDQPAAALLKDLKERGLMDETLVIWGGEFGRTPMNEVRRGNFSGREGRDHHPFSFTVLMAGGGIKGGQAVGQTDELGYHGVEDRIHIHDLQATILHCLGLDHERLTYHHKGRDFRLTDVAGTVIEKVLA